MTNALKQILKDNNLADYIELLERHKIVDSDILSELSESELEKIGIAALGDRKKLLKLFQKNNDKQSSNSEVNDRQIPSEIIVHHARKSGDDVQTGFGRGFGETVGHKAAGCAWSIGIFVLISIVITIAMHGC